MLLLRCPGMNYRLFCHNEGAARNTTCIIFNPCAYSLDYVSLLPSCCESLFRNPLIKPLVRLASMLWSTDLLSTTNQCQNVCRRPSATVVWVLVLEGAMRNSSAVTP